MLKPEGSFEVEKDIFKVVAPACLDAGGRGIWFITAF